MVTLVFPYGVMSSIRLSRAVQSEVSGRIFREGGLDAPEARILLGSYRVRAAVLGIVSPACLVAISDATLTGLRAQSISSSSCTSTPYRLNHIGDYPYH